MGLRMLGRMSMRGKLALIGGAFALTLFALTAALITKSYAQMWDDRVAKVKAVAETAVEMAKRFDAEVSAGRLYAETAA